MQDFIARSISWLQNIRLFLLLHEYIASDIGARTPPKIAYPQRGKFVLVYPKIEPKIKLIITTTIRAVISERFDIKMFPPVYKLKVNYTII